MILIDRRAKIDRSFYNLIRSIHRSTAFQDIPLHVSMITYLLIAWDRFRMLADPMKPRIPAFVCALGTWFFAVCIVLPYPIYTTYLDLEVRKSSPFFFVSSFSVIFWTNDFPSPFFKIFSANRLFSTII